MGAYANDYVAAKEVSIAPGTTAVITDPACYSIIVTQGHGKIADFKCEAPDLLRFGQNSADEFFVSEPAAKAGVVIENHSDYERWCPCSILPIIIRKYPRRFKT